MKKVFILFSLLLTGCLSLKTNNFKIDKSAILQALRKNQSKFQKCYKMALNKESSFQGNLGMQWLISSSGRGQRARAFNNQTGSSFLSNCLAGVLEKIDFPKPPSGQTPKIKFTFRFFDK